MKNNIEVELSNDEALVFFDWLVRFNKKSKENDFIDQSEQRVLFNLEAGLEKKLIEPFQGDYEKTLLNARSKIRD